MQSSARLRFEAGLVDGEEQLTNALVRATTTGAVQRVYVVAGHGEPELRDDGPGGLSRLVATLAPRGIELVPLPLAAVGAVPDDARAVVLLPTTAPWSAGEDAALARFVDGGGAVLVLLEPPVEGASLTPMFASLCGRFGVDVLPDVIVDDSPFHALLGGADVVTGASQMAHAITRPLAGALTHFPRAVALGLSPLPTTSVVPLVSTGAEARADRVAAQGPLPLVVAAEPASLSTTPRTLASSPTGAPPSEQPRGRQRAVVAADATFVQNAAIGVGANRDLAQNVLLWLIEDDSHIVVHPHVRGGALVFLTPSAREALAFVLLVVVPGLLAALGAAFTAVRRAR
jgi:hypothetical protein